MQQQEALLAEVTALLAGRPAAGSRGAYSRKSCQPILPLLPRPRVEALRGRRPEKPCVLCPGQER